MSTLYKVLKDGGRPAHGGAGKWALPVLNPDGTWKPGKWMPKREAVMCRSGYHLTADPMKWPVIGMEVYEAEGRGAPAEINHETDKAVYSSARLLRPVPEMIPGYWRAVEKFVREDIPAIPWFKNDEKPRKAWKLYDTRGAAQYAARDAAWYAARDAAWYAAQYAARGAARDAAQYAAWDAAQYAARDAAQYAARDAAQWYAAWDAAWGAALYAAVLVCEGLSLARKHVLHVRRRWEVWHKGYGLLCDVNGVLFVYRGP